MCVFKQGIIYQTVSLSYTFPHHYSLCFFTRLLAAIQISTNLEQQEPHLKDYSLCPLYCCFSRLSAMRVCDSEMQRGQKS